MAEIEVAGSETNKISLHTLRIRLSLVGGLSLLAVIGSTLVNNPPPEFNTSEAGMPSPSPHKSPDSLLPQPNTPTAMLVPTIDRTAVAEGKLNVAPTMNKADRSNATATVKALTTTPYPTINISATQAAITKARVAATARLLSTTTSFPPRP